MASLVHQHGRYYLQFFSKMEYVYAVVSLSGVIIEHDLGYRASELEILSLYSTENNSHRRNLAHRLGWPGKVLPLKQGREAFPVNITEIPSQEV